MTPGAQYQSGDIRLVGGSYPWEGRVEIYLSETWGTVTDTHWSNDDAKVVCRKLGYFRPGKCHLVIGSIAVVQHCIINPSGVIPLAGGYFGEGSGIICLNYILCSGREYSLTDCETANNTRLTTHSEDVGVICQPGEE